MIGTYIIAGIGYLAAILFVVIALLGIRNIYSGRADEQGRDTTDMIFEIFIILVAAFACAVLTHTASGI